VRLRKGRVVMAAYSYKDVMYRADYQLAIEPCMKSIGCTLADYDGGANYDEDGWTVAAYLLDQKDARIAELEAMLKQPAVEAEKGE
jgi:hypothetical protein